LKGAPSFEATGEVEKNGLSLKSTTKGELSLPKLAKHTVVKVNLKIA
jgi:hypothetical protein